LSGAVAPRYAAALADVAIEKKSADRVRADLEAFVEAFSTSGDLRTALESPAVSHETKHEVVEKVRKSRPRWVWRPKFEISCIPWWITGERKCFAKFNRPLTRS
jgi:hypothetical protein